MPQEPAPGASGHRDALPGRPRRIGIPLVAVLVAGTLLVGIGVGYSIALSQVRESTAEASLAREDLERLARAHAALQERNWMLYLQVEEARTAEPGDEPPVSAGVFTDGTYRVGPDIEPGTYLGEVNGEFGYWARLRNTTGIVSGIIANDIVRGPFVLTIVQSDTAVELRGVTLTPEE
ncbi:MAG: hypothetical protein ACNA76_05830 [Anaerosomatales bacterium]